MADDAELKALAERLDKIAAEITEQVNQIYAISDALDAIDGGGEVEPPEPPPELILSRSNVTAVEELPVGALLGCRLITAAVTFDGPPGARPEKLVGAASTKNSKGGMCMERRPTGEYSVWVQADGTQTVQLPLDSAGPMFLTFELPDNGLALTAEASDDTDFTAMPREPDPFDGAAACWLATGTARWSTRPRRRSTSCGPTEAGRRRRSTATAPRGRRCSHRRHLDGR